MPPRQLGSQHAMGRSRAGASTPPPWPSSPSKYTIAITASGHSESIDADGTPAAKPMQARSDRTRILTQSLHGQIAADDVPVTPTLPAEAIRLHNNCEAAMSLIRLVYYSAFIAGWAAFLGWVLSEWLFFSGDAEPGAFQVILIAGIIGAAIGLGLNVVAGMANAHWKELLRRALPGLVGGFLGGAVGGTIGNLLYALGLPRAIGWLIMGLGIGVVEGAYEKSEEQNPQRADRRRNRRALGRDALRSHPKPHRHRLRHVQPRDRLRDPRHLHRRAHRPGPSRAQGSLADRVGRLSRGPAVDPQPADDRPGPRRSSRPAVPWAR